MHRYSKLKSEKSILRTLVPALLDWFSRSARDLPWRRTRDPYAIWISEIMLQQTQVKTVLPYWKRWMRELPTVQALAAATSEKIHKLWEGLGYYTRVRNLHRAARIIVANHHGRFPESLDEVLVLPGIGRYTAGAICSIAFNQPTPALDGNVVRVLTRVFGISKNPKEQKTNAKLWRLAEQLVHLASRITHHAPRPNSRTRPRTNNDFVPTCSHLNQSLMELGALICTPRAPKCESCPVAAHCVAFQHGRVDELPNLGPRPSTTTRRFAVFIAQANGRLLVRRRPGGVVNAHLWEFPNVELTGTQSLREAARSALGLAPRDLKPVCTIKHSITRYRIALKAYHVVPNNSCTPKRKTGKWLTPKQLEPLAFTAAHGRILERLGRLG